VTDSSNDYSQTIKTHFYSVMMLQVNQSHTVTETSLSVYSRCRQCQTVQFLTTAIDYVICWQTGTEFTAIVGDHLGSVECQQRADVTQCIHVIKCKNLSVYNTV